jgi:hypothetical protein
MEIQRLRNLTTGRLHTEIGHVYQDIEYLIGEQGIMTHMLPRAARALEPILRARELGERLWDEAYDVTHTGEIDLPPLDANELSAFWEAYKAQPNPLAGKDVIAVAV